MDRWARLLFILSAMGLSFFAGIAVMHFKVFPYQIVNEAKNGLDALLQLEDRDRLVGIAFAVPDGEPGPHFTTYSTAAGDEPLLFTGGFFQYMSVCPEFGCAAWIATRDGAVLHTWEFDPARIAEDAEGFEPKLDARDIRIVSTRLARDGGLYLTFHARNTFPYTVGIARIDRDSKLIWKRLDGAHHWFDLDRAGNVYTPFAKAAPTLATFPGTAIRQRCPLDRFHSDGIAVISDQGALVRNLEMVDILVQNDLKSALYSGRDGCDPFHVNSIEYFDTEMADAIPGVEPGDLLISVREANLVAILDSETGAMKYRLYGYTTAQHSPKAMPDGTIVVFDNKGGDIEGSGTRILQINPVTKETRVVYPRQDRPSSPLGSFWTAFGGHIDVSPDGTRLMISSEDEAVSFEIDVATGDVLWSMEKVFDTRPYKAMKDYDDIPDTAAFSAYSAFYLKPEDIDFLNR